MTAFAPQVPIQIPAKLLPLLQPRRFKIMRGGRGGGKSHTVAQVLLALGLQRRMRILCVREVQKSLAESSMQVLRDYIARLGLGEYYTVLKTEIRGCNGTTFGFSGLQDHTADSIKSWEGADIVWVEEAHSVTAHSWNILIPTIRKPGSEIWATYNPVQLDDYVHDRFVVHADPDAWVAEINWRDNPWFGVEMDTERRKLQALNDDLYRHVWEGECRSLSGLMFKRHMFKFYDALPDELSPYMASDYAVTDDGGDWTEHGVGALDARGDLYLLDWWSGQTAPEAWIDAAVQLVRRHKPLMWFEERGVILRAVDAAIAKRLRERDVWIAREPLASAGNKAERALGFLARASAGAVWLPKGEPWAERLVNQLCSFTGEDGRTDDMVDVCSLLARGLDRMANARPPERKERAPIKPFTRRHFEAIDREEAELAAERKRYYR